MTKRTCPDCQRPLPGGTSDCPVCVAPPCATTSPTPKEGLSIVIPAYNEAERIEATVRRVLDYARRTCERFELVVVDDGSSDGTAERVVEVADGAPELVVVRNSQNRGKGYSVRAGALKARFPFVLLSDADMSTPIEEFEKLAPHAAVDSVVIASRGMPDSDLVVRQPFYRETMGKIFNLIVRTLLVPGVSDTQCGFKLFGRDVVAAIFPDLAVERWAFDVEVIARALRLGFHVHEVPVRWLNDERSRVHPIKDSSRMLADVLRVAWKLRRGGASRSDRISG